MKRSDRKEGQGRDELDAGRTIGADYVGNGSSFKEYKIWPAVTPYQVPATDIF